MKNLIMVTIFLLVMTLIFAGTTLAENMEPIKNPTLKDLQGKWEGISRLPWRGVFYSAVTNRYERPVVMTFDGAKASYSSKEAHFDMYVKIAGDDITLTAGKRTDVCKLNSSPDTLALDCKFEVGDTDKHMGYSGTMRLEKKK